MTTTRTAPPADGWAVDAWEVPGWLDDAVATVDDALARAGLARTGPARWMRRWPLSAVLRVPVGASAVWFKAVPPLFAHEGRVARWVADACPGATPRVLGAGDGWLIADEMPRARTAPRGHVMSTLARVQLASVGGTDELLALGCPARGLDRLLADVDELLRRPDLLPAATAARLHARRPRLAAVADDVAGLGLPPTLVHGDVYEDNVRWTDHEWMIIDWTDACVGHPFVDLARPLMNASPRERRAAETAFLTVWTEAIPRAAAERALRAAPALGAAHQVGTYLRIVDEIGPGDGMDRLLRVWADRLVRALGDGEV